MKLHLRLTVAVFGLFFATTAMAAGSSGAGVVLMPQALYFSNGVKAGTSSTVTTSRMVFNGVLGYKFSGPLFVGGTYNMDRTASTGGTTSTDQLTGYGPSVGLMTDRFHFIFTYLVGVDAQADLGSLSTKYTSGSGYNVDLGYTFMVSSKIGIGPSISYRSTKTTKRKVGSGTEANYDLQIDSIIPYVAFKVQF